MFVILKKTMFKPPEIYFNSSVEESIRKNHNTELLAQLPEDKTRILKNVAYNICVKSSIFETMNMKEKYMNNMIYNHYYGTLPKNQRLSGIDMVSFSNDKKIIIIQGGANNLHCDSSTINIIFFLREYISNTTRYTNFIGINDWKNEQISTGENTPMNMFNTFFKKKVELNKYSNIIPKYYDLYNIAFQNGIVMIPDFFTYVNYQNINNQNIYKYKLHTPKVGQFKSIIKKDIDYIITIIAESLFDNDEKKIECISYVRNKIPIDFTIPQFLNTLFDDFYIIPSGGMIMDNKHQEYFKTKLTNKNYRDYENKVKIILKSFSSFLTLDNSIWKNDNSPKYTLIYNNDIDIRLPDINLTTINNEQSCVNITEGIFK